MQPFWKAVSFEEVTLSSQRGLADAWLLLAQKPGPKMSIKDIPQGEQTGCPVTPWLLTPGLLLVTRFSPLSREVSRPSCLPQFSDRYCLRSFRAGWVGMIRLDDIPFTQFLLVSLLSKGMHRNIFMLKKDILASIRHYYNNKIMLHS